MSATSAKQIHEMLVSRMDIDKYYEAEDDNDDDDLEALSRSRSPTSSLLTKPTDEMRAPFELNP